MELDAIVKYCGIMGVAVFIQQQKAQQTPMNNVISYQEQLTKILVNDS